MKTLAMALTVGFVFWAVPSWAHHYGAQPGPAIEGELAAKRGGCPEVTGEITVAVGETVYFGAVEVCDVDMYEDPYEVDDVAHTDPESWSAPGASEWGVSIGWGERYAVYYDTGDYTVSVTLVDDHIYADDDDRGISISVHVKHELTITGVCSTDGRTTMPPVGGTIGLTVEWTGSG